MRLSSIAMDATNNFAIEPKLILTKIQDVISRYASKNNKPCSSKSSHPSMTVNLWTVEEPFLLDMYAKTILQLVSRVSGGNPSGIVGLPLQIKKWSVLSSPFVHKTAFTQLERRIHKRKLVLYGLSESIYSKIVWYFTKNAPLNVHIWYQLHYHRDEQSISD